MNIYEKIFILDPNLDDAAVESVVEKVKDVIVKQGGEVLKTENWGRRKLAYALNKRDKGCYILLLFQSPPKTISELERFCKVNDSVVKFMVVKLTKKKQIEAAMPKSAESEGADVKGEEKKVEESPATETSAEASTEEQKDV
jgi:small subunit ribosomal protein S6